MGAGVQHTKIEREGVEDQTGRTLLWHVFFANNIYHRHVNSKGNNVMFGASDVATYLGFSIEGGRGQEFTVMRRISAERKGKM